MPEAFDKKLYIQEIEEAIDRVESGDYYTQEEVEKLSIDWWKSKAD